jgi:hypothetical protein
MMCLVPADQSNDHDKVAASTLPTTQQENEMKNITITVTDDQGMVIFEFSTPEIAEGVAQDSRLRWFTVADLEARDVVDEFQRELECPAHGLTPSPSCTRSTV